MKVHQYTDRMKAMGPDVDLKLYKCPADADVGGWMGDVFWTRQKYREDGGYAGGFNSYVLVAHNRGRFVYSGQRVKLVCINGCGESRWDVSVNNSGNISAPAGSSDVEAFNAFEKVGLEILRN